MMNNNSTRVWHVPRVSSPILFNNQIMYSVLSGPIRFSHSPILVKVFGSTRDGGDNWGNKLGFKHPSQKTLTTSRCSWPNSIICKCNLGFHAIFRSFFQVLSRSNGLVAKLFVPALKSSEPCFVWKQPWGLVAALCKLVWVSPFVMY